MRALLDWNTAAAATGISVTVTVGGTAYPAPIAVRNFDAVSARRLSLPLTLYVPRNTSYNVNSDNTTNLTINIKEVLL